MIMNAKLLVALLVAILGCVAASTMVRAQCTPGAKATVLQSGINQVINQLLPFITSQVETLQIPSQSGTTSVPILGGINYSISNIVLQSLTIGNVDVSLAPGGVVVATVSGISLSINFDWSYSQQGWPHIGDSGSGTASCGGSTVDASVTVGIDSTGRPTLVTNSANLQLNSFSVNLNGGFDAWLFDLLGGLFNGAIASAIESSASSIIQQTIDTTADQAIASLVLVQPTGDGVSEVDFTLCSEDFTTTYLSVGAKGEFYRIANPTEAPFVPPALPDESPNNNNMAQLFLSDYVANSAAYVYYTAGELAYLVTPSDVPPTSPFQLNTTSFRFLVPPLYQQFPNCAMQVDMYVVQTPISQFTSNGIDVNIVVDMEIQVIQPNGQIFNAFTLEADIAASGCIAVELPNGNPLITGSLQFSNFTMTLKQSNIGQFNAAILEEILTAVIKGGVLPYLNKYLQNGYVHTVCMCVRARCVFCLTMLSIPFYSIIN
eukprot:GEZU01025392.1.p1 GENE.GEZU01025392.1~~GEZU01025392.1.p1  ORF type:complete len:489 (+),score=158.64 GEZU01025392.1:27-1493(+)